MRPRALFTATAVGYTANCALGAAVRAGVLRTDGFRWVHHALYVLTCTLAAGAVSSLLWSRSRAGWLLLPAAAPLTLIAGTRGWSRRHVGLALSVAPFAAAALVAARRGDPDRTVR